MAVPDRLGAALRRQRACSVLDYGRGAVARPARPTAQRPSVAAANGERATTTVAAYRDRHGITDPVDPFGQPTGGGQWTRHAPTASALKQPSYTPAGSPPNPSLQCNAAYRLSRSGVSICGHTASSANHVRVHVLVPNGDHQGRCEGHGNHERNAGLRITPIAIHTIRERRTPTACGTRPGHLLSRDNFQRSPYATSPSRRAHAITACEPGRAASPGLPA